MNEAKPRVSLIASISKNRGLGKDNKLLFHIPGDLPRFKAITTGHPVIMGRKTFESLNRPSGLPGRLNIVVSRDPLFRPEGITVCSSIEEAVNIAKQESRSKNQEARVETDRNSQFVILPAGRQGHNSDEDEIFIIGGGQIFEQALPFADRLYLTVVDKEADADTFFPNYSAFTKVIEQEKHMAEDYTYTFLTLEK